jgi:hypothetical protein
LRRGLDSGAAAAAHVFPGVRDTITIMASSDDDLRPTFRLIHLFVLTALICICLAIYMQWGVYGVPPVAVIAGGTMTWICRRYRLVKRSELLTVWLMLIILSGLALPAVQMGGPHTGRPFFYLGEGIRLHHDAQGELPPASTSPGSRNGLSWRLIIADYIEGTPLSFDRTLPWDDPANAAALQQYAHHLRCPLDGAAGAVDTSFVAITGPDTCWPDEGLSLDDIPDGAANTILVVDSHKTGIAWTEPRDFEARELNWQINAGPKSVRAEHGHYTQYLDGSKRPSGPRHTVMLMADGSIESLSANIDPEVLQQLVNRRDGQPRNGTAR